QLELRGASVASDSYDLGHAGQIVLSAPSMLIADSSRISSAANGAGRGGDLFLDARGGSLRIENSTLSSEAFGDGDAGTILIAAGSLAPSDSFISSAGGNPGYYGRGGLISIDISGDVTMDSSTVSSKAY